MHRSTAGGQFSFFDGQTDDFPYRRFVVRQHSKRDELCGPVTHRHSGMGLRYVMRQMNDVIAVSHVDSVRP